MALDNLSLSLIVSAMEKNVVNAVFSKPFALSTTDYALPFNRYEADGTLRKGTIILSLNPANPYLTFSYDRYQKVDDNSPFFNSLKKLSFGRIRSVKKLQGERVVTINIDSDKRDITEINSAYDLIVELFPNHPNCYIIAYPYGRIVSLCHERVDLEKGILLSRNSEYIYPKEREVLSSSVTSLEEAKPYLSNACYKAFSSYVEKTGDFASALKKLLGSQDLYLVGKTILPFHFGLPEAKKIQPEDIYSSFVKNQKEIAKMSKVKELIELIEKAIKTAKKKLSNLKEDLQNAKDSLKFLDYGQTIYLYQAEIHKGDKVLERDGYTIPLDGRLDAVHNANRYFKKYAKAKSASQILGQLIDKTKDEVEYLEKKLLEAKDGTPRDIQELKSELLEEGYIKEKQGRKSAIARVSRKKSYDPHYLVLESGAKIGFGMNGLQNETLTFQIAKKDDLFFHVKDYPGSHVAILDGREDSESVLTACELALFLSHLESGEVMLTPKKNVKKNPEKIGLVNILKYETLNIKEIRKESLELFRKALKY